MTEQTTPPTEASFFRTIRSWGVVRGSDGVIGGVASGVGAKVGLAPFPARAVIVLAGVFLFPVVMLAYAAAWALLPDAQGNIIIQNFGRGVTNVGALLGIGFMAFLGFVTMDNIGPGRFVSLRLFDRGGDVMIPGILDIGWVLLAVLIPLGLLVGTIALVIFLVRRSSNPKPAPGEVPVWALTPEQARAAAQGAPVPTAGTPGAPQGTPSYAASAAPGAAVSASVPPVPPPPPAPPAPRIPTPRVPGPGRAFYLLTLAWALVAAAAVTWAGRENLLTTWRPVAWGLLFLTGLGVILMGVSISGRRVGFLGFLGVLGMFPGLILAFNHDHLLKDYADGHLPGGGVVVEDIDGDLVWVGDEWSDIEWTDGEPLPETPDWTAEFADQYSEVFLSGECWAQSSRPDLPGTSVARFAVDELGEPRRFDSPAHTTFLSMPAGAGLVVAAEEDQSLLVWFADRELACDGFGRTALSLRNGTEPAITVTVPSDYDGATVVIQEN